MEEYKLFIDFEFLGSIESHFGCAGMCEPGLFYFGGNVTLGPPKEVCLPNMIDYVVVHSSILLTTCFLNAIVALALFLLHFF